ncbi:hypothetical protein ACFQ4C_01540 [Larkinella insperata]|uniref:Lipoprotein n=1 Tax=Larkinella insperata TaxID=332158 RepID=A0ABW3Q2N9_9BACT|nr:hypothetical protein [Larkinella insperata]
MKKSLAVVLTLFVSVTLISCDPLDKKYDKENYSEVMAEHADSASRSAFNRATVENEINDRRNEDFTYQELIEQGKMIQRKEQPVRGNAR